MGNKKWLLLAPVALPLGILLISLPELEEEERTIEGVDGVTMTQPQTAGLFSRKSTHNRPRSTQFHRLPSTGKRFVLFRKPTSKKEKAAASNSRREITIKKSSADYKVDFGAPRKRWKYLSSSVRRAIDRAKISKNRWKYVVVHNSATAKGSAKVFDRYHREVRRMSNGLAYHFVIGNGTYTKKGEVEIGDRWYRQLNGGHLKSSRQNAVAIGICLVGDFNHERVGKAQLEALDELIDYLRAKVGKVKVTTHRQINIVPTSCPGRYFPSKIISG